MPLPRVAVLCAISGLGGAEISLLELVTRLRDSYEFHLIVPGEGLLKKNAELAGAKTRLLPWPEALARTGETAARPLIATLFQAALRLQPWTRKSFTRQLSELIAEIGPSAFVTNAVKAHVIGALIPKPRHMPLIWYMRDGLEGRAISRKMLALLSRHCDLAVCISNYVELQFRRYVSTSVPTSVLYNIVDLNRFHPDRESSIDLRPSDLEKKPGEIWYGMVGAITPLKGHDIFLDAAEKVLQRLPNAVFVIVGDNPYATETTLNYRQVLKGKVEHSSLRGRVKFLGFREDVPGILSLLDVLVQPNRGPEGLGRSVLEALACAVPVVAVNQWGPAELIRDGQTGLLFPPLDIEKLADRMIALGADAALRKSIGNRGCGWIQQNLVPDDLAKQFAHILTSAIHPQLQEAIA